MIRAFQWDLARQTERLDRLLAALPRYSDWGYQELYLHLEDAVDYPGLPGVARPGAYSWGQMERLVAAASRAGIGVVPIVNLLGHTQYLIGAPGLRDLNELRGPSGEPLERGQVCPLHPRLPEVARALIRDAAALCTAGKVHVGLDESFALGRHPLSRAEIARVGLAGHFAAHVHRLRDLAAAEGLRLGLWADMLALLPEAVDLLPPGIAAYDWYYYAFGRKPRVELRNFAPYDLAPALRARGIGYWGCPMNGAFRHEPMPVFGERMANILSWWRRCQATRAEGLLVTSWEPNRLALEMTTVVDAAAACLWLNPEVDDTPGMLARGFQRVFGRSWNLGAPGYATLAREALACDERAFTGYARWEINERWDVAATREGPAPYREARGFYSRLAKRAQALPIPFAESVRLLRTLTERDVFVRESAGRVFRLRRMAARLWGRAEGAGTAGEAAARLRNGAGLVLRADGAGRVSGPGTGRRNRVGIETMERALAEWGEAIAAFAPEIQRGRAAARRMRLRTRRAGDGPGPNEIILAQDAVRLRALKTWVGAVARDLRRTKGRRLEERFPALFGPTPVCGRWQLQFAVLNREPALQKVVVEEEQADGRWIELHGRATIEFRALAARPRGKLRREFSVPVRGPAADGEMPRLRLSLRGLGRVWIVGLQITNGVEVRPNRRGSVRLGEPAPQEGWPDLDWSVAKGALDLSFA